MRSVFTALSWLFSKLLSLVPCGHDWVAFREPDDSAHYPGGTHYWNQSIYLGWDGDYSDYTCSKCNKMKLKLEKAMARGRKRAAKTAILDARRNEAKLFAVNNIKLADRA